MIYPSELSVAKMDEIVNAIDDNVPSDYLLIMCCHFPMMISTKSEMYTEQPGWIDKHLWKSGKAIAKRIIERRSKSKTHFLFGDGHLPDFWQESPSIQFFMTGMFGGDFVHNTYIEHGETLTFNKTNQARLFRFNTDHSVESITTYNYVPEGLRQDMQGSKWEAADSTNPPLRKSDINVPIEEPQVPAAQDEPLALETTISVELISSATVHIDIIASHVQTEILTEIRNRHLYTIARTASSDNESSLGWLPINLLFQKTELLARCVDRGHDWLCSKTGDSVSYENSVIIGIGFWGAIIGSQLSVRLGVRNYCIASNLSGYKNSKYESLDNLCIYLSGVETIKKIIVVTDVISTGNSICKIKKSIEEKCGAKEFWCAISVIADKRQERSANISEYNLLGSFCTELAIPIVKNEFLPDETIFPIEYDYR
jgi:hypoxanthine-guanine phosphoribosyltransferase